MDEVEVIEVDHQERSGTGSPLALNKKFASNILKQVGDHNRIKSDIQSRSHRKFENDLRKEHTRKNLRHFSHQKTMYSDYVPTTADAIIEEKKPKRNIITPFQQVQKLVTDAAEFDEAMAAQAEAEERRKLVVTEPEPAIRKNRISLDKTLLHNHLKHTNTHNRLKEEEEMWDQHKLQNTRKVVSLKSRSSSARRKNAKYGGSMYSDRESNKVVSSRVKTTPDETSSTHFGEWTRKLLKEKEKDPDKWSHTGFKALYKNELKRNRDGKKLRKIVLSSDESSDCEEEMPEPVANGRRVVKRLAESTSLKSDNGSKREVISAKNIILKTLKQSEPEITRNMVEKNKRHNFVGLHADLIEERPRRKIKSNVATRKFEHDGRVVKRLAESTSLKSDNGSKRAVISAKTIILKTLKQSEPETTRNMVEKNKRHNFVGLHADLIEEPPRRKIKSNVATRKWEHDGFQELDGLSDSPKKKVKSLAVMKGDGSTSKVTSVDCDEWTEKVDLASYVKTSKHVENSKEKTVWKRLHDEKDNSVNRVTLKNSLHDEEVTKTAKRLILSNQEKNNEDAMSHSDDGVKSKKAVKIKRTVKRKHKHSRSHEEDETKISNSNNSDSSFTESSSDERYKKIKKKKNSNNDDLGYKATFSDYDSDFKPRR